MPPQEEGEEAQADFSKGTEARVYDDNDDVEANAIDDVDIDDDKKSGGAETHKPTCFSDARGNLKFVNLVVRNPCSIFFSILILNLVISFLLIAIVFRAGNPFTSAENEFDLKDERSVQYDSLRLAIKEVSDDRDAVASEGVVVPRQSENADVTYWVFEGETGDGVFGTPESIGAMKEAFDLFLTDKQYPEFCRLDYPSNVTAEEQPTCSTPITSLTMYYPSQYDTEKVAVVIEELKEPGNIQLFNRLSYCYSLGLFCDLLDGLNISDTDREWVQDLGANLTNITSYWDLKGDLVENITQVTELASYLNLVDIYKGLVSFGYDKNFAVENPVSMFSRGIVRWGGPLSTSNSTANPDDKEDAEKEDDDKRKDYIVDNFLDDMNDLANKGTHSQINTYYFMGVLIFDVLIGIVSQDGMLAIISLLFVFFWLRINTNSWFLAGVGILEIFLAIPVAWFIFTVVFRIEYFSFLNALSIFIVAAIGADDIFIFMDAYKQSAYKHPEHLVDLETRMSWVYRRTGTAMMITSVTTCSAFLCTLITPLAGIRSFGIFAAIVILVDYILVMTLFCTAVVIYHDRFESRGCCGCCCTDCSKQSPTLKAAEELAAPDEDGAAEQGDRVSLFFRTKVAPFIQMPIARLVLGLVFLSWIGVATWQTTKIEAIKDTEQFLDENHPLQKSLNILNNEFPTADEDIGLKVYYSWGVGEVDRSGVNQLLDPTNFGTPTFVESFDFNEECQSAMVKTCTLFKTDPRYSELIKRERGLGRTYCFLEELAAYNIKGNLRDCDYVNGGEWKNEDWQIPPADLASIIPEFLQQRSCFDPTKTILGVYGDEIGWDGKTMKYAAISVESEVLNPFSRDPESTARNEYDQFVEITKELESTVSTVCSEPIVMTDLDGKFVFMNNQSIYVQTAIQSSILGVAIAFVVLFISTRVFHIALFASLSICSVLVSVTGIMVMLGWDLGSIESILIGIIAGFSVDYVVHLAHAYKTADGDTYERITEAFSDMGISVLNGMVTSIAASIPLFFCQLQFFAKFGTFLCLTIAFSWIFANFGFMSVLAQCKIPVKKGTCNL